MSKWNAHRASSILVDSSRAYYGYYYRNTICTSILINTMLNWQKCYKNTYIVIFQLNLDAVALRIGSKHDSLYVQPKNDFQARHFVFKEWSIYVPGKLAGQVVKNFNICMYNYWLLRFQIVIFQLPSKPKEKVGSWDVCQVRQPGFNDFIRDVERLLRNNHDLHVVETENFAPIGSITHA